MKPLVIYGAGGHAREMLQVIRDCNADGAQWDVLGFARDSARDSAPDAGHTACAGLPVRHWAEWRSTKAAVLIAIGHPAARRRVATALRADDVTFPNIVHPSVIQGERIVWGEGIQVAAGAILTVDLSIGNFALINRAVNVSHDCTIGDYATIAPLSSLSGRVRVGEGADLGTGVLAIPGVTIGEWSTVGAGAVVTSAVPENATAVGVPARVISLRAAGWYDRN